MKCPTCDDALSISSREGVEIDFCPQCRGVWLDRGELDKIIERAAQSLSPSEVAEAPVAVAAPAPGRREPRYRDFDDDDDDFDDRRRGRKRRRRSFLDDIFDFDFD